MLGPQTTGSLPNGPRGRLYADEVTGQARRLEIAEAKTEGWLGKVEGLQVSLAGAEQKLRQLDRGNGQHTAVDLGACVR